jgi:hypothetical protein
MSNFPRQPLNRPDAVYDATQAERRAEHCAGAMGQAWKKTPYTRISFIYL